MGLRTRTLPLVFLAAACAGDHTTLIVERQPTPLAATKDDGWIAGGAVLVAEPGSLTFPQTVSVRMTLIDRNTDPNADPNADPDADPPEPKLISRTTVAAFDDAGSFEITQNPICQPTYCEAELRLDTAGSAMLQITATGKDVEESDCFYYAIYEDADPVGATLTYRDQIEAKQLDCQKDLFD